MTHDIKATVDYIEQLRIEDDDDAFPLALLKEWPSLLAELRRCWAMIERARKESKVDGDMQRLLSEFSLRSDNRAMARELEQASAKLVEQQNVIVRLRAIEETARRYREAYEDWDANESMADDCILGADQHEARDVLFSLLDAKPTGGEEAKP